MSHDPVVELLRDVALPADPADRVVLVRDRARRAAARRTSALGAALAAVLVAGLVGAFTVSERDDDVSLVDVANATEEAGSYRLRMEATTSGATSLGADSVRFTVSADVDAARDRSVMRIAFETDASLAVTQELRQIGDDTWFKHVGRSLGVDLAAPFGDRPWLHTDSDAGGFGDLAAVSPSTVLRELSKARRVRDLPAGEIDGVAVSRYVVRVDGELFSGGRAEPADQRAEPGEAEVAVDQQGRLRRMSGEHVVVTGAERARTTYAITYSDFGLRVRVSPPDPDEVRELGDLPLPTSSELGTSSSSTDPCDALASFERLQGGDGSMPGSAKDRETFEHFLERLRERCAEQEKGAR